MSELLVGYYKAEDHFYKIVKVCWPWESEDQGNQLTISSKVLEGECQAGDGAGTFFPLTAQYGDFGGDYAGSWRFPVMLSFSPRSGWWQSPG